VSDGQVGGFKIRSWDSGASPVAHPPAAVRITPKRLIKEAGISANLIMFPTFRIQGCIRGAGLTISNSEAVDKSPPKAIAPPPSR